MADYMKRTISSLLLSVMMVAFVAAQDKAATATDTLSITPLLTVSVISSTHIIATETPFPPLRANPKELKFPMISTNSPMISGIISTNKTKSRFMSDILTLKAENTATE